VFRFYREDPCRVPERTKRDLGLDAFFPHELVKDPLNPLRSWTRAFDDSPLVDPDSVHHNDHSRIIHHAYHSWKDPFKSLAKTLKIKWLLKTRYLDNSVAVQKDLVDITSVRLCISEADAKGFGVNARQSADESLSLSGQDANVFLEKIREFFHELPARGRRQLSRHP